MVNYMIYHVQNFVKGLGGVEKAKEAIKYFRKKTIEAGFPGLELQVCIQE